jgi:response regulator RpfG family c-di-GMP phosphodiesterase
MNDYSEIVSHLKKCEIFLAVREEELMDIASQVRTLSFSEGEVVFKEGTVGNTFYIVKDGMFGVFKETGRGMRDLKRLCYGEIFGEMALIAHGRRSATVKAVSDAECIEIRQDIFSSLVESNEWFSYRIMNMLASRLQRTDQKATQDILNAHQALIFSLSYLAESRDYATGAHIYRVREYCALLAQLLTPNPRYSDAIDPVFVENIYTVSPLHDIGKVAIPDSILLKPGPLTEAEFEIIKTHTSIGAKSIAIVFEYCDNETFRMAYNVVLHHHEKYNGDGYPLGLKGDDIPLEARIVTMADVYDALLSERCYKPAFSYADARKELQSLSGTLFDPDILHIMMDHIEAFESIHQKYSHNTDRSKLDWMG